METRNAFINEDGFDKEGALEAAIDERNFLPRRILKHNTFSKKEKKNTSNYSF